MPKPEMKLVIGAGDKPDDKGKVYFTPPDGFDMEGKKPGDEIEFVGTAHVEDDGRLCLTKMDGMELVGSDEKEPMDDEKKGYGDFVSSAMPGEDGEQQGGE